jgi:hypothetical protein
MKTQATKRCKTCGVLLWADDDRPCKWSDPPQTEQRDTPLQRLRHHVTGAIERGEAQPITEQRDTATRPPVYKARLANGLKLTNAMELERQRDELQAHAERLAVALKGVAWKIQAYGSHWEPSQAERDAIRAALAQWEGEQK